MAKGKRKCDSKYLKNVKRYRSSDEVVSKVKAIATTSLSKKCGFCKLSRPPELKDLSADEVYGFGDLFVHYFCMLFSSEGVQAGADDEGLFGFLLPSVRKELSRGATLKCKFCRKPGATICCKSKGCKTHFHFPCGTKGGCLFEFTGNYSAYCCNHRPPPICVSNASTESNCVICFEQVMLGKNNPSKLSCPGCDRSFHSRCVQRMALSSGSQCFKCPNCNNSNTFLDGMRHQGIYVPDKDAEWEQEENSNFYNYGDLYRQVKRCSAIPCYAEERDEHKLGSKWEIILCDYCGLNGIHIECGGLDKHKPDFACKDCKDPLDKLARQDRVTCLAYNVDSCVVKLGRLPELTPSTVVKAGVIGKKALYDRLRDKLTKERDAEGVVLVSCLQCKFTTPWMFMHHMEAHLEQCFISESIRARNYPSFISIFQNDIEERTRFECNRCIKVFKHISWLEKHLKVTHEWENFKEPSPISSIKDTYSSDINSSTSSSDSEEDDETIREIINHSQAALKSHINDISGNLYSPKLNFDLTELELNITISQFAKTDQYQLIVFIGDITQEERNVLIKIWKHLNEQVSPGNTFKCPQCQKYFSEWWQLTLHMSTTCTLLFDQFFETIYPIFEKQKCLSEFNLYKEKMFSFMSQQYCLLCGKPPVSKKSLNLEDNRSENEAGTLQNHLINFHLKKKLLQDRGEGDLTYSCTILGCNLTFPSCSSFLLHMSSSHGRVEKLLHDLEDLSQIPGTQPVKEYANPFTQERFKCNVCGKKAVNKSSLMIHLTEHNSEGNIELKCSMEGCDYISKFSPLSTLRHFGFRHQIFQSYVDLVELESSDEESTSESQENCVVNEVLNDNKGVSGSKTGVGDDNFDIVKDLEILSEVKDVSDYDQVLEKKADDMESLKPAQVSENSGEIKIIQSCSIDVSQFNMSTSEIHQTKVDSNKIQAYKTIPKDAEIIQIDSDDDYDDDDMPVIKFKRVPLPLVGSFVCPFCNTGYREKATLLAHLVSSHFREKLAFMVPGTESPFACPKENCKFRHKTREGVGNHLGGRHGEVVISLVRKIFPDFSFSKHDEKPNSDDILIEDEIIVLGESSHVQKSEFVGCEVVSDDDDVIPEPVASASSIKTKARPVVLPLSSSVDLTHSPHARIAPILSGGKKPMNQDGHGQHSQSTY